MVIKYDMFVLYIKILISVQKPDKALAQACLLNDNLLWCWQAGFCKPLGDVHHLCTVYGQNKWQKFSSQGFKTGLKKP